MTSSLQRLTAWLCLVVALFAGFAPAQGFVLCLEPDGELCVDLVSDTESCVGCDDDGAPDDSPAPHDTATEPACCPCADYWVPGRTQDHPRPPRTVEFQSGPWVPAFTPPGLQCATLVAAVRVEAWGDTPRPRDSLALIRSVVLLV